MNRISIVRGGRLRMVREYFFIFMFGAVAYSFLEIIYRGRTHWSMTLTGGVVLVMLYLLNTKMQPSGLLVRCLLGCLMITVIELSVGCVVNRMMHWGVWDYSAQPYNVLGQICPTFTGIWFLLCIPGDYLCGYMHKTLFA